MNNGRTILNEFVEYWKNEFKPDKGSESHKNTSAQWSDYLREFLEKKFEYVIYECAFPLAPTKRLDAAVWSKKEQPVSPMDIAVEWEWDFGKADSFVRDDFVKALNASAKAGLAIVKTRSVQKNSLKKAEKFIEKMKKKYDNCEKKDRPVGVIEVRRIKGGGGKKKYQCYFHDFSNDKKPEPLQELIW